MAVRIAVILERKGPEVATVSTDATLGEAIDKLAQHNVGALVVSNDGRAVEGIISERDIVRQLAEVGADCLGLRVTDAMTSNVTTSGLDATADELMTMMTDSRFRHVPVMDEGQLVGIVSIGDVVKSRLDELEMESEALHDYVSGSGY